MVFTWFSESSHESDGPLVSSESAAELTDSQLLDLFLQTGLGQKARGEWAMTQLIERHSPMVLAVCARSLRNRSGAEDAAQSVFLLLWKKAATLTRTAHSLGGWLHRTAVLVCKNANREAQNRQKYEQQAAAMMSQQAPDPVDWAAVREVIDTELDQLPDKYRVPLVLYHLEGRSVSEVAAALTAAEATVGTWLARGRDLLAERLMRHGSVSGQLHWLWGSRVPSARQLLPPDSQLRLSLRRPWPVREPAWQRRGERA